MTVRATLLTEEQIWGSSSLDVMENYGRATALTDCAIALGGLMGGGATTVEGDRSGYLWSASAT